MSTSQNRLKGKTSSGFVYDIPKSRLDDYEFAKLVAKAQEEELYGLLVVEKLLGKDGEQRLLDTIRKEDGTVPVEAVMEQLTEIFNSSTELKN